MMSEKGFLRRAGLLLGSDAMQRMAAARVIVFGTGGVGSWCAESLVRSGICHLTLVDADRVCVTNINRQLMATTKTVGKAKVDALRERLLEINPDACITALEMRYDSTTAGFFQLETYDYIIDAIDSVEHKAHLIRTATGTSAVFFSSMGAALKMSTANIRVADFWKVQGCPLARALRTKLRKPGMLPAGKFRCVYSEEVLANKGENPPGEARVNGSLVHVTAIFGFTLAGLVIEDICRMP